MIPITRFDGVIVGNVLGDTFYTHRNHKDHFYIIGQGYPIGDDVLDTLKTMNVKRIYIIEHMEDGSLTFFQTEIERYLDAPIIEHPPFERQRCVSISELEMVGRC